MNSQSQNCKKWREKNYVKVTQKSKFETQCFLADFAFI